MCFVLRPRLRSTVLCFVLLLSGTAIVSGAGLSDAGVLVGATAEVGSDTKEGLFNWKDADKVQTVIRDEFGLVQTTAYPAWGVWTGSAQNPKMFDFTDMNRVIDWAQSNNKKTCIHLIAGSGTYFPDWFNTGNWTTAQVEEQFDSWITGVVTANSNNTKVDYWNVVNEVFTWDGNYWPDSTQCRWQQLGWEEDKSGLSGTARIYTKHPVYIRKAFEKTRALTSAKLELRDYYVEFWDGSKKTRAFYQLVKHLVNSGVPIDAVGFQGHFRLDKTYDWSELGRAVEEYKALGLEVYITELDYGDDDQIAPAKTSQWTPQLDEAQCANYHDLVKASVAAGVDWLCLWGVADNTNQYWRMGQNALLFDEQYRPKNAYESFRQGIVDGKEAVATAGKGAGSGDNRIAPESAGRTGSLKIPGDGGTVRVYTVSGRCMGTFPVCNRGFRTDKWPHGVYLVKTISREAGSVRQEAAGYIYVK